MKYCIISRDYNLAYHIASTRGEAIKICDELSKAGRHIAMVFVGKELAWKPKEVVTVWELEDDGNLMEMD